MFLYELYQNDNQIDECFTVLVRIGDDDIYNQFDKIFKGKKNDHKEKVITENVSKLLAIDMRKTWEKLQQLNETPEKKKAKVRECVNMITKDKETTLEAIEDEE